MTTTAQTQAHFTYKQDWDNDGMIEWQNARTLGRYRELSNNHANVERLGCFFAIGEKEFDRRLAALIERGVVSSVNDIVSGGNCLYGTPQGVAAVRDYYDKRLKLMAAECDPQEVYCYEFNNHESMIAYDGDYDAFQKVVDLFGAEKAAKVKRFCAFYPFEHFTKGGDK